MTETKAAADYAASVVQVLSEHFSDLTDPATAMAATDAIKRQALNPRDSFEYIVDDPWSARWRLKADSNDRHHVKLAHFPVNPRGFESAAEFERTVNEALASLLAAKEADQ